MSLQAHHYRRITLHKQRLTLGCELAHTCQQNSSTCTSPLNESHGRTAKLQERPSVGVPVSLQQNIVQLDVAIGYLLPVTVVYCQHELGRHRATSSKSKRQVVQSIGRAGLFLSNVQTMLRSTMLTCLKNQRALLSLNRYLTTSEL